MDKSSFAKLHKAKTGYSLRDEQVTGSGPLKTKAEKAKILAEALRHDKKSVAKKMNKK